MTNILPTIKVNIFDSPGIEKNILLGASCSLEEVDAYKSLFQEFHDIFSWSYQRCMALTLPSLNIK
jgi:hypothetical protein